MIALAGAAAVDGLSSRPGRRVLRQRAGSRVTWTGDADRWRLDVGLRRSARESLVEVRPSASRGRQCKSQTDAAEAVRAGGLPARGRPPPRRRRTGAGRRLADGNQPTSDGPRSREPEAVPAIWTPAAPRPGTVEGFVKASKHKKSPLDRRTATTGTPAAWISTTTATTRPRSRPSRNRSRRAIARTPPTYNIACGYALLGNSDRAFEYLKKAMDEGFDVGDYLHDDDLDGLHSDPRWPQLKKEARENGDGEFAREPKAAPRATSASSTRNPQNGEAFFDVGLELLRSEQYDLAAQAYQDGHRPRLPRRHRLLQPGLRATRWRATRTRPSPRCARRSTTASTRPTISRRTTTSTTSTATPRWTPLKKDAASSRCRATTRTGGNSRLAPRAAPSGARPPTAPENYVEKNPQSGRGWYNLGFASLAGDRPEDSIEAFQKALDLGYRKPTTMYNLACAYSRLDQKDPAFEWLNKAIDAGFDADAHDPQRRRPRQPARRPALSQGALDRPGEGAARRRRERRVAPTRSDEPRTRPHRRARFSAERPEVGLASVAPKPRAARRRARPPQSRARSTSRLVLDPDDREPRERRAQRRRDRRQQVRRDRRDDADAQRPGERIRQRARAASTRSSASTQHARARARAAPRPPP